MNELTLLATELLQSDEYQTVIQIMFRRKKKIEPWNSTLTHVKASGRGEDLGREGILRGPA